jgi:hypothetical protein
MVRTRGKAERTISKMYSQIINDIIPIKILNNLPLLYHLMSVFRFTVHRLLLEVGGWKLEVGGTLQINTHNLQLPTSY